MPDQFTLSAAPLAGDLPGLSLAQEGLPPDAPLILVLHGLSGQKERLLPTLYAFAKIGCRAAAFDLPLHGERSGTEGRDFGLQTAYMATMTQIIDGGIADASRIVAASPARAVGLHGLSLGGYLVFGAMMTEPRTQCASVAMGSPDWLTPLAEAGLRPGNPYYDAIAARNPLDLLPHVYPPRPLLMQHGDQDEIVSMAGSAALADRLKPLYSQYPNRLAFHLYPDLGHFYTDEMLSRSAAWFQRHLLF